MNDCIHDWRRDKRGHRCASCALLITDGVLPLRGLEIGVPAGQVPVSDFPCSTRNILTPHPAPASAG